MDARPRFGLIGTITYDVITGEDKTIHEGLGGILYQAAVLCGLGQEVNLYTNLGKELETKVQELTKEWTSLDKRGIKMVPGPGNRVFLDYPEGGERIEVLKSVVPPINLDLILKDLPQLDFLVMSFNSGFDMESEEWERVKKKATCPIWLDIHSLLLEKKIGTPRAYVPLQNWKNWVEGIYYLQANKAEVAALLNRPGKNLGLAELENFGEEVLELGVKAVFLTRGAEGLLLMGKKGAVSIPVFDGGSVVDTTGCGDVLCAGAVIRLSHGRDPYESAVYGMNMASAAAGLRGVSKLFLWMKSVLC
jgi:sugar/nucleoside kinase (ribokinase family)